MDDAPNPKTEILENMRLQLARWKRLAQDVRDARAHNLPKSFSEALDALNEELIYHEALVGHLDEALTDPTRCSKCGGEKDGEGGCRDYCTDDTQESDQNIRIADELGLNFWVYEGRVYEGNRASARPATDQEVAMWGQLKRWRDGMAAVAGSK